MSAIGNPRRESGCPRCVSERVPSVSRAMSRYSSMKTVGELFLSGKGVTVHRDVPDNAAWKADFVIDAAPSLYFQAGEKAAAFRIVRRYRTVTGFPDQVFRIIADQVFAGRNRSQNDPVDLSGIEIIEVLENRPVFRSLSRGAPRHASGP